MIALSGYREPIERADALVELWIAVEQSKRACRESVLFKVSRLDTQPGKTRRRQFGLIMLKRHGALLKCKASQNQQAEYDNCSGVKAYKLYIAHKHGK